MQVTLKIELLTKTLSGVPNLQFEKVAGLQLPNCKFGTPERDKHFQQIAKV
jgi:hypothetical protein